MKRNLKWLAVLLALGMTACGTEAQIAPSETAPISQTQPSTAEVTVATLATEPTEMTEAMTEPTEATEPQRFLLTFVGDCTLGASKNTYSAELGFIKTVGTDYEYPFRNVSTYFQNDDATFLNLEGPLTDRGLPMEKRHVFHGPTEYVNILTRGSVEVVSLSNNHTMDYGLKGYRSTRETLDQAGVPYVEQDTAALVELECGLTVGLYGTMYAKVDTEAMAQAIADLRAQGAELVIVASHWGTEYTYQPTTAQQKIGRGAIDAGADIVWGTHPHVLQPIEEYGDGVILYSLGNFSFGGNTAPEDRDTVLLQQEVVRNADGSFSLGERTLVPCCVSSRESGNNFQPTPYEPGSGDYDRVLAKLNGTYTQG